jgi:hypothetical protein
VSCHWEEYWFTDDYYFDEGDNCDDDGNGNPAPLSFPFQFANYFYEDPDWGPDGALYRESVSIGTSISFWSGGAPGSTATRFFKLHASAYDNVGHANISSSLLGIAGGLCDSEGNVYRLAADNDWYDCTVGTEGDYADFTFNVEPSKAKLAITRGGVNITDQTNTVIVGEQIALTCQFLDMADQPFNIAPITNFQWTIPGDIFSNYVADANSATFYGLTNAADFTNSTMKFFWKNGTGSSLLEVQCTAIAKGISMTTKTRFKVLRPDFQITSLVEGAIEVNSTNYVVDDGVYLHFGYGPPDRPGIRFDPLPQNVVEASYELNWIQIIDPVRRLRFSSGSWWRWAGAGLDRSFPYHKYADDHTDDTPGLGPLDTFISASVDDTADMFLMYTSGKPGSKMVPLRKLTWRWMGVGITNGSGGWTLSTNLPPTNLQDANWTTHPTWSRNVDSNVLTPE